jgi:predicted phage-related endonuclease
MPASWRPEHPWVCPAGRRVLSFNAPREQWLRARRALLCASDVAKVLGWSQWGDAYTIWLEKTGRAPLDETSTVYQARGLLFEAPIVELWAHHYSDTPIEYRRQGLMASDVWVEAGASVDWLSICPAGRCLIEVKSQADMAEWAGNEVPLPVQGQVMWQLFVTGRDHVHVVAMGPRYVPAHRLMRRDQVLIDWMVEQLQPWWDMHIVNDVAPEATRHASGAIRARFRGEPGLRYMVDLDTALRLGILREEITERTHELEDLVAAVQAKAGDATEIVADDGDPIASWLPGQTIDGADQAWKATHPELVERYGTETTTTVLNLRQMVADHPELLETGGLRYRRPWTWDKRKKVQT